jgi:hypothetical protein
MNKDFNNVVVTDFEQLGVFLSDIILNHHKFVKQNFADYIHTYF